MRMYTALGALMTERERPVLSERGCGHWPAVKDDYSGRVRVYESSSVEPHVWLAIEENPEVLRFPTPGQGHAHLTIEQAREVRYQLGCAIRVTRGQSSLEHFLRGHGMHTWIPTLGGWKRPLWPIYKRYAWWKDRNG